MKKKEMEKPKQIIFPKTTVDDATSIMILVGYVFSKGLINQDTYDAIKDKVKEQYPDCTVK